MVRAKFTCREKSEDGRNIILSPVVGGSEENDSFFEFTPGGSIDLFTVNPEASKQFEPGQDYYVDFTKA